MQLFLFLYKKHARNVKDKNGDDKLNDVGKISRMISSQALLRFRCFKASLHFHIFVSTFRGSRKIQITQEFSRHLEIRSVNYRKNS